MKWWKMPSVFMVAAHQLEKCPPPYIMVDYGGSCMVWGFTGKPEDQPAYLGLGLGLGLLVADTSYAPRGMLNIESRARVEMGDGGMWVGCVSQGEDTWAQGRNTSLSCR